MGAVPGASAVLSTSGAASTIHVAGTGFVAKNFTAVHEVIVDFGADHETLTTSDTPIAFSLPGGFFINAAKTITSATIDDKVGGHAFNLSGFYGTGSATGFNDTGAPDTIIASKNADFALSNAALTASDGLSLILAGVKLAVSYGHGGKS